MDDFILQGSTKLPPDKKADEEAPTTAEEDSTKEKPEAGPDSASTTDQIDDTV